MVFSLSRRMGGCLRLFRIFDGWLCDAFGCRKIDIERIRDNMKW